MSTKNLDALFNPRFVAVIGASAKPHSLGTTVLRNMLGGEFGGVILPVNPKYESVLGVMCFPNVEALPRVPDLAVLCVPLTAAADIIDRLARLGTRAAILMAMDNEGRMGEGERGPFPALTAAIETARHHGMRLLGPGSTGLQVPAIGLNASWISTRARPGRVALVSQSSSVTAGVAEWAARHGLGFSHVVSAGDAIDVGLGDILDHLATDARARAVLLYVRSINDARTFLSAARAIARVKPVVVLKAGRRTEAAEPGAALSDGSVPAGLTLDAVYDAAFRRAGMLRVLELDEVLAAVETLTARQRLGGERVAILCNGSGPGEMAADALLDGDGVLAEPSGETRRRLLTLGRGNGAIGATVDIGRDATPERYGEALRLLADDSGVDAVLTIHTPTAEAPVEMVAAAIAGAAGHGGRAFMAGLLGDGDNPMVRQRLLEMEVPLHTTPERAARAFLHLVHHRRNQALLWQTPSTAAPERAASRDRARALVRAALAEGRTELDEREAMSVLAAYGLNTVDIRLARTPAEAGVVAGELGFPVGVRPSAPKPFATFGRGEDISHELGDPAAVAGAVEELHRNWTAEGNAGAPPPVVARRLIRRQGAIFLTMGMASVPPFGRVILLGSVDLNGGRGASGDDRIGVALPPLNDVLARDLIDRTPVGGMLAEGRERVGARREALVDLLIRLSDLAVELPEVVALDIDPVMANPTEAVVLSARMALRSPEAHQTHVAIRPYPQDQERLAAMRDGHAALLRPVRPDDWRKYQELLRRIDRRDLYLRYCRELGAEIEKASSGLLAHLYHIDYDREMTFVAEGMEGDDAGHLLGVVELNVSADHAEAEFSVLARGDRKGTGLGRLLMERAIEHCREAGIALLFGLVLRENEPMLRLARRLGFSVPVTDGHGAYAYGDYMGGGLDGGGDDDDDMVRVEMILRDREA